MKHSKKKSSGFTLIEVLIALAILAIALTAIVKASSSDIADTSYLRDKSIAHWVGLRTVNAIQLGVIEISGQTENGSTQMLERQWLWVATLSSTGDPHVAQVTVSVKAAAGKEALVELNAFKKMTN